jgi:hypothetical protein
MDAAKYTVDPKTEASVSSFSFKEGITEDVSDPMKNRALSYLQKVVQYLTKAIKRYVTIDAGKLTNSHLNRAIFWITIPKDMRPGISILGRRREHGNQWHWTADPCSQCCISKLPVFGLAKNIYSIFGLFLCH